MCSDVVLQARGISKNYRVGESRLRNFLGQFGAKRGGTDFWALHPLDLIIKRGEVIGIIGQNGSGKSTLLQMLCGTLQPTQGQVKVAGRLAALLELGAGFNPEFTGRENVYLCAALYGLNKSQIDGKFSEIEDFADIGDFIDKPVKTYSSGMFVRLAFSVIAHVDADILVIDEALAVGDVFFTQKCMRFLEKFAERGTILFVSHDSASVVNLCNRAFLLEHGKLIAQGSPRDVTETYMQRQYAANGPKNAQAVPSAAEVPSAVEKAPVEVDVILLKSGEFGCEGARIEKFQCVDQAGSKLVQIQDACKVKVSIKIRATSMVSKPLVGFSLKDRHGKVLFGANTDMAGITLPAMTSEDSLSVMFYMDFPALTQGEYMFSAAVGDGTEKTHVMHHWIHDVYPIQSICAVNSGLMNVPFEASFLSTHD